MRNGNIEQAITGMSPGEAARELIEVLKRLFCIIDEQEKIDLVMNLFGGGASDKIGSMVHR